MKKLIAAALVLAASAALPAGADHGATDFVATGTILVGNPASRATGGLTEIGSPCMGSIDPDVPNGTFDTVDGTWVLLPEGAEGHAATLTSTEPNDVDAWFYDAGCGLILEVEHARSMAGDVGEPDGDEAGTIPAGAKWAVIDLYVGAAAPFTFTISDVLE